MTAETTEITEPPEPVGTTPATPPSHQTSAAPTPGPPHLNEVALVGRVSVAPEDRELPSGDRLVTLRVVVDRPPEKGATRRVVDVVDVACWSGRARRSAAALLPGDTVRVEGALRRRFFGGAGGRTSRYEVEAARLVRLSRQAAS